MQITGEHHIGVPPPQVWQALNDPDVLQQCIPGCESLTQVSPVEFEATVKRKIGPVSAKFVGTVTLSDIVENESYVITGSAKGGAAGFASGRSAVRLAPAEGGTRLTYEAEVQVRGKLAQLGSRLINAVAKKTAATFFERFCEVVGGGVQESPAEDH